MLKKYKNIFLKIIIDQGFDPNDFSQKELLYKKTPAFALKYRDTPLEFIARNSMDNYHDMDCIFTKFAPNFPLSDIIPDNDWFKPKDIFVIFERWLKEHLQEYLNDLNVPDMWEQVDKSKKIIEEISIGTNDQYLFSKDEKEEVRKALNIFKDHAGKELLLSEAQILLFSKRVDYLAGAVDRLTKFDWKNVAVSTIMSISIALSLDVEKGRLLFNLFKEAFKHTLKLITN